MKRVKRTQRPRRVGRLRGTKYDFQVPNLPYSKLIHLPYSYKDKNDIQYYVASENHWFVQRQMEAGSIPRGGGLFWTLRPIVRGVGRRMTEFPHVGQTLSLFALNGKTYSAYVQQDYILPRHATGWVIMKDIFEQ